MCDNSIGVGNFGEEGEGNGIDVDGGGGRSQGVDFDNAANGFCNTSSVFKLHIHRAYIDCTNWPKSLAKMFKFVYIAMFARKKVQFLVN